MGKSSGSPGELVMVLVTQDGAQSNISLYQKQTDLEGVDSLLSPTTIISSVIQEAQDEEDNVAIVIENN